MKKQYVVTVSEETDKMLQDMSKQDRITVESELNKIIDEATTKFAKDELNDVVGKFLGLK